jgi:hypothetical protein
MMPATAMRSRRMIRTTAVAGLNVHTMADHDCVSKNDEAPAERGPHLHTKVGSVPWGGLGGYPFTPWTNVP